MQIIAPIPRKNKKQPRKTRKTEKNKEEEKKPTTYHIQITTYYSGNHPRNAGKGTVRQTHRQT